MKPLKSKDNTPWYGFELHWDQRSCDTFLGIPYNITSYATLALILEAVTGHKALGIQCDGKKVHLYDNSIIHAMEQINRTSNGLKVSLDDNHWFESLSAVYHKRGYDGLIAFLDDCKDNINLDNYKPQSPIIVPMLARTV